MNQLIPAESFAKQVVTTIHHVLVVIGIVAVVAFVRVNFLSHTLSLDTDVMPRMASAQAMSTDEYNESLSDKPLRRHKH